MYRYWNLGWLVPPSAGAASGVSPNPVGYNRMYVKLDGEFSVDKWYQGVKAGQIMLSNGPILFFEPRFDKGTLTGRIEATSRTELDRVELVANAKVIQRWKPSGKRFRAAMKVNVERYSWVAARCYEKNEATVRLRPHRSGQTGRQVGRAGRRPVLPRMGRGITAESTHSRRLEGGGAVQAGALGVSRIGEIVAVVIELRDGNSRPSI